MPSWIEKHSDTLITIATIIVAFAVLVTILDQRLDTQDKLINQRFDAQDRYINQRFDAIDQRFDAIDKRIDRLTDEVSELRKLSVSISERVSRNEGNWRHPGTNSGCRHALALKNPPQAHPTQTVPARNGVKHA